MTVLGIIAGVLAGAAVLVLVGRLLDRARDVSEADAFSGWYRGKTSDETQTGGFKAGEYDSMNDHGHSGPDGGL